jgi:hypothetical protein
VDDFSVTGTHRNEIVAAVTTFKERTEHPRLETIDGGLT